jgi:hypothetical protein
MRERPPINPRPTYLHKRGEFLQPTERVKPHTPEVLPAFPAGQPRDRLGFARWLVSRQNPLAARVFVNREWAAFFGRGLVATLNDFGMQGESPTHPELLDWLALEFMDRGWSRKQVHRTIVMSAAYRQTSRVTPQLLEKDFENRLLARAPRLRLPAETIRDAALRAAGLLSTKAGGPGVRPPQPEGVTEVAYGRPKWLASQGEDRYRRSVYTFMKRTAPFAMFVTFDATSGEACTAQRTVSNTALQALTLLNDVMFKEIAQALGERIAALGGGDVRQAGAMFRRVLTREPVEEELQWLTEFVTRQRRRFSSGELDPAAFVAGKEVDQSERAVWTALARVLFSLDEAVTRN